MKARAFVERLGTVIHEHKVQIAAVGGSAVVGVASAGDIADSIEPIVGQTALLIPYIVDIVIAAVPVLIILGLIAFFTGIFDGVLGKIKV